MANKTTWQLDPAHTNTEFSAKHMMFTTVRGHFTDLSGTIRVDEEDPSRSSVEVEIDASSLDTGVEDRDNHLRSGDFLDVENHPKLVFKSKRVEGSPREPGDRFKVIGDLTIRGNTHEVTLEAEYQGRGPDPWGGERTGFSASTTIDRRDWGLTWNKALEAGGILVSNEVKIELDVQAVKETEKEKQEAA